MKFATNCRSKIKINFISVINISFLLSKRIQFLELNLQLNVLHKPHIRTL